MLIADVREIAMTEERLEYYMNRNNRFYFRKGKKKITIDLSDEKANELKKAYKYGQMLYLRFGFDSGTKTA